MSKILISYRRQDSADISGRMYDRLVQQFGRGAVFKDVDSMPLGVDFRTHIDEEVSKCNVCLVVIGPDWIGPRDGEGKARLEDPEDIVRIEVESALKRKIPVIPVLVRGVSIPSEKQLPETLQELSYRNGLPIRSDPDFHRDINRLIGHLIEVLKAASPNGGVLNFAKNDIEGEGRYSKKKVRTGSKYLNRGLAGAAKAATLDILEQTNKSKPFIQNLNPSDKSISTGSTERKKATESLWSKLLPSYPMSRQAKMWGAMGSMALLIFAGSSLLALNTLCPFGGDSKDGRCVVLPANSETTLFFDRDSVYFKKARSNDCGSSDLRNLKITKDPVTGACKIEFEQQVPRLTISSTEEVFYYKAQDMGVRQSGIDLYGYDYRRFECKDIDFCEKACATDPLCKAFALGPKPINQNSASTTFYCWLKSEINETPKRIPSVTSGIKVSKF
jgi:hypothetical protein